MIDHEGHLLKIGKPLENQVGVRIPRIIRLDMSTVKPLTIETIDVENDRELDMLMAQVLSEGDKIYASQREEAIRLGIIDEKGRLLKSDLPDDMREDAGTDFGG